MLSAILALDVLTTLSDDCSAMNFEVFSTLLVHAMDMMQLPLRRRGNLGWNAEIGLAVGLSKFLPHMSTASLPGVWDPRLLQLMKDAWRRLRQSGVLEKRGILDERKFGELTASYGQYVVAAKAALSAPGLRCCELASCGAREAHSQHFKSCTACLGVVYCCREHQVADWPAHKAACKAARKTAAAANSTKLGR